MIIIGIDQTKGAEKEAADMIKELSQKNGIYCECLSERKMINYLKYRRMSVQSYLVENYKEQGVDILLIDFNTA